VLEPKKLPLVLNYNNKVKASMRRSKNLLWLLKVACLLLIISGNPLQASPNEKGSWSDLVDWPLIAIHTVMTPDGKILTFGTDELGRQGAQFLYDVWNPDLGTGANAHNTLINTLGVDSFCSAAIVLPESGNILMSGGDNRPLGQVGMGIKDSPIFNTASETLTQAAEMSSARWYPTATTLANGDILLNGGRDGVGRPVSTPEVYSPASNTWRSLLGVSQVGYGYIYPRQWVAPDGRVFGYSTSKNMYYIKAEGNGQLQYRGKIPVVGGIDSSTAVMYQPGKILHVGGPGLNAQNAPHHNSAHIIDINDSYPVVTETADPQQPGRILVNSVVLPNGKVMIVGGSGKWNALSDVATQPEIWDPTDGSWSLMEPSSTARLYHSTALLLKDGRVLVAGGGAPGPLVNTNAEIFSPPYLFDSDGMATRPDIITAPDEAPYGSEVFVRHNPGGIVTRVTLIKTGAVTHSYNMEQRFIELNFTVADSGNGVKVTLPDSPNTATPGYYLLHLLNDAGVPSKAHVIRLSSTAVISVDVGPQPVANIDSASATAGTPITLDVLSNDIGNGLFLSQVSQPTVQGGTSRISNDKVIYTSKSDFNGTDSFWYSIEDNQGRTSSAQVTVSVSGGVVDPTQIYPTAAPDSVVSSGGNSITIDALANDTGNDLSMAAPNVWSLKGGSVLWVEDKILYTPKPGFNGVDKIWYVLRDVQGRTNSGEITITVSGNDTILSASYPTASPDTVSASAGIPIDIDALANDRGTGLTLIAPDVWSLKGGNVSLVDNKIRYLSAQDFTGVDKIWYAFSDAQDRTNSGEVTITVTQSIAEVTEDRMAAAPHRGPTYSTNAVTTVNQSIAIDALVDRVGNGLVLRPNASSLKGGDVSLVGNKIVYIPKQGYVGRDRVWFVFESEQGLTYNGEVLIDVNASADNTGLEEANDSDTDSGVTTGGGGSFSWWLLMFSFCLALSRNK